MHGPEQEHRYAPWRYHSGRTDCPGCRSAWAALRHARAWERYGRRVEVDGRMVVVDPAVTHGITHTYNWRGCRCPACTEAIRVYHLARRRARRAT